MANENMVVVAVVSRKGGSGKSMLVKALASAAVASERSVLLIDADPQGDVADWFARAQANGLAPDRASFAVVKDTPQLNARLTDAYENETADFVFIDSPGVGTAWADDIAQVAHVLLTPIMASRADLQVAAQTMDWFKGLHARVEDPDLLPAHRAVVTRFPAKASKREADLLAEAVRRFPICNTTLQSRVAYVEMDEQGFLGEIVLRLQASPDPLERGRARQFQTALLESNHVLNDALGV